MVLPALLSLKGLIKTKSYHIDLPFFRLHYQATVCLLLAFCLILTAKILFGETIKCNDRAWEKDGKFLDNICYAVGTYTSYEIQTHGKPIETTNVTFTVHPKSRYTYTGVALVKLQDAKSRTFWHNYYQYVPLILFIQAIFFYLPHYLWKLWENGTISSICQRLHEHRFAPNEYFEASYDMVYYIQNVLKFNKSLVYKYYFCHVLCLLNLVLQIIALDMIFNHQFVTYGYVVMKYMFVNENIYGLKPYNQDFTDRYEQRNLNNPMDLIYPKVTICHFEMASRAGLETDKYYPLCVLPLNILHDKFFLLLWFWFLILVVLTVVQIINDLLFTAIPEFRRYFFTKHFGPNLFEVEPDDSWSRPSASLQEVFLLYLIGHNSDKFSFSALLRKIKKDDCTACPSENRSVVCSHQV